MNDEDGRPSPDALLAAAQRDNRGRLKIFLGAAPGVGKTYEMLLTAQTRRREGLDVVVGVVETHGRKETQALLDGLEIIPRHEVEYRGHKIQEMDLDAVLARRPQLVLVDELAHSNAPNSRHPKRYLDVEELLAAGIDVYTTLNIQHVESLNDVVARITRIRVRETVPDSIIDRADDIEVIDLTPEDLLQRLKEGKVYLAQQAERAINHYFSAGNLTALRELALRRTAQRVDDQMVDYMRSHAISGPWAAGDRVLVYVDGAPNSSTLIRHTRRLADRLRARWTAIHVELAHDRLGDSRREQERSAVAAEALRLAQRLGGEAVTIPDADAAAAVVDYARTNNCTHIIVGMTGQPSWRERLTGSTAQRIISRAAGIHVHVLADRSEGGSAAKDLPRPRPHLGSALQVGGWLGSVVNVAVALGIALLLRGAVGVTSSVALVFLMAVLASAVAYGLAASLLTCLISVLAYNFFFLPPLYTFTIADPENVVALVVFAVVAVVASNLTARMRAQTMAARLRAKSNEELYQFSRKLASAASLDDVLWATAHQIALMLKIRVVILLPDENGLSVQAGFPPEDMLDDADLAAAKWAWEHNHAAGRGADTLPGGKRLFLPMQTGRGAIGVLGFDRDEPGPMLTPDQRRLVDALSDQAALAIERVNLVRDIDRAQLQAETDRLRSALLTSISHDLRTPLASILGAATNLTSSQAQLDDGQRSAMLRTIQEEAERLNRFIGNLLDMTRLESGPLALKGGLADLSDVVGAVLRRAERILAPYDVRVDLQAGLPMLNIDMVLFEQVLFNLLDNAAKYSSAGSTIWLRAFRDGEQVRLQVLDEGDGIPEDDLERIFDKFYRVRGGDRQRAGTGLGLAICRGFVEAMHGSIRATNRTDRRGAVFTITLPVAAQITFEEEDAA
jgi:two-component system, OmpR family, sensor histidine kinase KdpD